MSENLKVSKCHKNDIEIHITQNMLSASTYLYKERKLVLEIVL